MRPLRPAAAAALTLLASVSCWAAFSTRWGAPGILITIPCLCALGRLPTARQAFYGGLTAGVAVYVPHLLFFLSLFGRTGLLLWLIAGFPIGIFVLLLYHAHRRLGENWTLWLTPVLWTGVEYFRSEGYYLRFAWLLPGQAAAFLPGVRLVWLGVYGLGFLYALAAAMIVGQQRILRWLGIAMTVGFAVLMYTPPLPPTPSVGALRVAGIQLENSDEDHVVAALDRLAIAHPEAQILVMSEYSFIGPVPDAARAVMRKHHRYLIIGGIRTIPGGAFYNTAFVIGPDGRDVFEQAKSVPVQFFQDGLPAPQRQVWNSPWGRIGIAVCYDLSYVRVMDDFVRAGAEGLIIPTMDLASWGEYERRMLHGRLAPIRSAEYGVPTFGVWSSGVSQLTDRYGRVLARAGYPGQGDTIAGPFNLQGPGRLPPDRLLAPATMAGTGAFITYLLCARLILAVKRRSGKRQQAA